MQSGVLFMNIMNVSEHSGGPTKQICLGEAPKHLAGFDEASSSVPETASCRKAWKIMELHNVRIAIIHPPTIKYAIFPERNNKPPRNKVRQFFWGNFF